MRRLIAIGMAVTCTAAVASSAAELALIAGGGEAQLAKPDDMGRLLRGLGGELLFMAPVRGEAVTECKSNPIP